MLDVRLIDANALGDKIKDLMNRYAVQGRRTVAEDYNFVLTVLSAAPTINPDDLRPHGRWVHDHYENCTEQFEIVKCSNCGFTAYAMAVFVKGGNYCPNCGAKMDGKEQT